MLPASAVLTFLLLISRSSVSKVDNIPMLNPSFDDFHLPHSDFATPISDHPNNKTFFNRSERRPQSDGNPTKNDQKSQKTQNWNHKTDAFRRSREKQSDKGNPWRYNNVNRGFSAAGLELERRVPRKICLGGFRQSLSLTDRADSAFNKICLEPWDR